MKLIRSNDVRPRAAGEKKFTEGVWHEEILEAQQEAGMRVHRFVYDPGSHSHWHSHDGEQALYGVAGIGLVTRRDGQTLEFAPGDLVYVTPGEEHWHGAAPESLLVHFAFTASGRTHWFEEVTSEEYAATSRPRRGIEE
jgi:quercetin dioxygenase-like cupin family protein